VAFESLAPRDVAGGHALLLGAGRQLADLAGRAVTAGDGPSIAGCVGGGRRTVAAVAGSGPAKAAGRAASPRRPARPRAPVPIAALLDRAQGTLLGQLAGDALGSAVEFQPARRIAETHPEGVRDLVSGGTWGTMAGQPTDDSEMALALARSLAREGGFDAARVGAAYVAWGESDPFDIGNTTREGLAAIAAGRPARSESQANGALMRVSPIGILAAGNPARAAAHAAQDAALTHPHPVCRAASAGFAAAVAVGVAGGGREAMWAAAHAHAGEGDGAETVRATLRAARHGPPAHYGGEKMGWVLIALRNAVWQLMRGASLETAVIGTVSAGGDTDTNAAICGALLGAHAGRQAVPARWRRLVLSCRPIPGADTRHPRPPDYWPDDAMALAEAVLAAGREG
jgi:ADP-ribosylglycohydrolase